MTLVRYVFAALLAGFALLQLNDPDPLVWVVAYALPAIAIALPPRSRAARNLGWLGGGVLLSLALMSLPGFLDYLASGDLRSIGSEMSPDRPQIEAAREFLGSLIAATILALGRMIGGAAAPPRRP